MVNIKKLDYFDVITGYAVDSRNYGLDAAVFKKADNVQMIFDSRWEYLGIITCRGKFINGKYTAKQGPKDFKSIDDLKIWAGVRCCNTDFVGTKDGISTLVNKSW